MPFNHLWPLAVSMFGRGKSSPSQEACFCSLDCGEIKSLGRQKTVPSLPSPQISRSPWRGCGCFFCNPLMQSSVIVEITAGLLSGTTTRGGSEEGPVLTGIEPWLLTQWRPHCAWLQDGGRGPVNLPLYGSEEQSINPLSAQYYQRDLLFLFL